MTIEAVKCCTKCNQCFPATTEWFPPRRKYRDGLLSWCRDCMRVYQRQYSRDNAEKRRAQWRKHSRKPETKEKARKRKQSTKYKHWRQEYLQRPEVKAKRRKYAASPRGRAAVHAAKRRYRARKKGLPDDFTQDDWEHALNYFENRCAVCGREPSEQFVLAADHWMPLFVGGGTTATNILPLCHSRKGGNGGCNNSKSAKDPVQWLGERYAGSEIKVIMARIETYFSEIRDGNKK